MPSPASCPLQPDAEGYPARRRHLVKADKIGAFDPVDLLYGPSAEREMLDPVPCFEIRLCGELAQRPLAAGDISLRRTDQTGPPRARVLQQAGADVKDET